MFVHYEAYIGGYYSSFRNFYSQHRQNKNLSVRDVYLDLDYMRDLDYYLVKFVNYYARSYVWFLYGRATFFVLKT